MSYSITEVIGSGALNVDLLVMLWLAAIGEPDRSPNMLAATDQAADILDWFSIPVRRSGGSLPVNSDPLLARHFKSDVRAMRKVDEDQAIRINILPINVDTGVTLADGTYRLRWLGSALFSRTSR